MSLRIDASDYLPGERLIRSTRAQLTVDADEHGVRPLPFSHLSRLIHGKSTLELEGGLVLTNFRLMFLSSGLVPPMYARGPRFDRRPTQRFTILLPAIASMSTRQGLFVGKVNVVTAERTFEFLAWGNAPELRTTIDGVRRSLDAATQQSLPNLASSHPHQIGPPFHAFVKAMAS